MKQVRVPICDLLFRMKANRMFKFVKYDEKKRE